MPFDIAIILGILQGITEFIPVSSSGHLILGRELFSVSNAGGLAFDAVIHLATALAIVVYFRRDIYRFVRGKGSLIAGTNITLYKKTVLIIIVATIPAAVLGLSLESIIETVFRNTEVVAVGLVIGSLLILAAEHIPAPGNKKITLRRGLVIGLFQCLALLPGMSRSGATISGGLFSGFSRETATSFSFLLGLPIFIGAGGVQLFELLRAEGAAAIDVPLILGFAAAFVAGLAAMHFLMRFVRSHRLDWFAAYRILLAVAVLLFL
ncbi:MAG: undecaprenyl-diphosphatase UppP [Candidatus Paceibacterota bacterium]